MEGSKLLGIRLQDSAFLSEVVVNHLKKARGEIWPKRNEKRNNTKTTKMRTKKSAKKKKINSQINKYLDLAGEPKKLCNMKLTVLRILVGAFGKVFEGFETGLEELKIGRIVKTIQTIALLRSGRILRRVLET